MNVNLYFTVSILNTGQEPSWWRNPGTFGRILDAASAAGLMNSFTHCMRPEGKKRLAFSSMGELAAESTTWKRGWGNLSPGARRSSHCFFNFWLAEPSLTIVLGFKGRYLTPMRKDLIARFINFAQRAHDSLPPGFLLGPRLDAAAPDVLHPRPLPPRFHRYFGRGCLANFLSRDFHFQHENREPEAYERMSSAPLPPGARRTVKGGLLVLSWSEGIGTEAQVAAAQSAQEKWLGETLRLPIDGDFDETGARAVDLGPFVERRPPLTFYAPGTGNGYKAVYADEQGGVDEQVFGELASWIESGRLPDGTRLSELRLIAPGRAGALAVRGRALAMGCKAVYYPGGDNRMWDPFPEGSWLNPPRIDALEKKP